MTIQFNHTIVWCRDNAASAAFLTGILGLPSAKPFDHFQVVAFANGVSLDFMTKDGEISRQHYAFLVDDDAFDAGFARIEAAGLTYWADPGRTKPGEINHRFGGRGVYFQDPDGHLLELITSPADITSG